MSLIFEKKSSRINNYVKWLFIMFLVLSDILVNYTWIISFSTRMLTNAIFLLCITLTVVKTSQGKRLVNFLYASRKEISEIVWPTRQQTLYTTLVVVIATFIISLFLWILDSLLVHLVSFAIDMEF